jgi:hypothetical protein
VHEHAQLPRYNAPHKLQVTGHVGNQHKCSYMLTANRYTRAHECSFPESSVRKRTPAREMSFTTAPLYHFRDGQEEFGLGDGVVALLPLP